MRKMSRKKNRKGNPLSIEFYRVLPSFFFIFFSFWRPEGGRTATMKRPHFDAADLSRKLFVPFNHPTIKKFFFWFISFIPCRLLIRNLWLSDRIMGTSFGSTCVCFFFRFFFWNKIHSTRFLFDVTLVRFLILFFFMEKNIFFIKNMIKNVIFFGLFFIPIFSPFPLTKKIRP